MGEALARIVVVEDNPGDVRLLRLALREAAVQCEMQVLVDGAEGMALARREGRHAQAAPPDLIVLDLNLPKHDGLEVLEALRADPVLADVPVVVFSSFASAREQARVRELGASRFLAKPPDLDAFLQVGSVLRSVLREKGAER
jgi:CheY-like chemotaxis protein